MAIPTVSIIVPVYNVEKFLPACIDSILSQTGNISYEIILVDDGSTDNGGAICDDYAKKHDCIEVIHQENAGLPAARNSGLKIAKGEYIFFVDSDDFVASGLLEVCFSYINEDRRPDMIQFSFSYVSEEGDFIKPGKGTCCTSMFDKAEEYRNTKSYYPVVWIYLIRRDMIEAHHLRFAEELRYAEDIHFTLSCLFFASMIQTINVPLYYYRQRMGSLMTKKLTYKLAWYHLHIAELLIERFYKEKGSNYPLFFKERIYKLVVHYLKLLATLDYDSKTMKQAGKDLKHFNKLCMAKPGCITKGSILYAANLSLPIFVIWRKLTRRTK